MEKLTYKRYLQVPDNLKNGYYGTWEFYAEKILDVSIDQVAEELKLDSNIFTVTSKFYEMLKILLLGNKSITFQDYYDELRLFQNSFGTKTADEITEYIIGVLKKYINN